MSFSSFMCFPILICLNYALFPDITRILFATNSDSDIIILIWNWKDGMYSGSSRSSG
jgi:hypothetical protein